MIRDVRLYSIWLALVSATLSFGQGALKMKVGEPKPATVIPRDTSEVILVVRSDIKPMRFKTNHGKILAVEDDPYSDDLWLHIAPGTHLITFSADCYRNIEKRINIEKEQKSKIIEIEKDLDYFLSVKRTDQQPPRIGHTPLAKAIEGDTIVWDVVATDNSCVSEVKLFYRRRGETAYQSERMKKLENSDNFRAKLIAQAPGIEYYLEAWDIFGNGPTLWKNDAQPQFIEVMVQTKEKTAQIPEPGQPSPQVKKNSKKWILVGAGAVAVGGGVIAALAGGSGGKTLNTNGGNEKLPDPPGKP